MSDKFEDNLKSYMAQFNDGGVEAETPLFRKTDGTVDRERTLSLPCYSGFLEYEKTLHG